MRVFVLNTGRCGSVTFARSCEHMANYTSAHESRIGNLDDRLGYPDDHVEVDNRLAWMLGPLTRRFPDAYYIHLTRDPDEVAASLAERYRGSRSVRQRGRRVLRNARGVGHTLLLSDAWAHGIVMSAELIRPGEQRRVFRGMVDTITANIETFLEHRPHIRVDISEAAAELPNIWQAIGADGDLDAARSEFAVRYNATTHT